MSIVITWYSPTPTDITADVLFKDAQFTMNSGATPGSMHIAVKDPDLTYDFKASQRITLDIDGIRYWDGYALDVSQRFPFYVVDPSQPYEAVRIWDLRGTDVGLLFSRRYIFNQTRPETTLAAFANMPAGTSDLSYLTAIMTHLTLGSDGVSTDFHAVGSPNPDEKGLAISVGDQWATAMRLTAELPGAVWGMRPDRTVYYEDDDTVTAPFAISDAPNNVTSFGYSDYQWTNDGTRLINDAQIWGVGLGVNKVTYDRVEDADSIAAHGRWQNDGGWRYNLYVQSHVDAVAASLVYGSPEHLHGGKDDSINVKCRVRQSGLLAGQKVRIISTVFGDDVVLPIRSITVTFANAEQALYDLNATWEIDNQRSFYDWPPIKIDTGPPITIGRPPICLPLNADGWIDGLHTSWVTETSDPIDGEATISLSNDNASIHLENRQRYFQSDSNETLFLDRFDEYDATTVWVYAYRSVNAPLGNNWGFRVQMTLEGFRNANPRYARMPYLFFGVPIGAQDLTAEPLLDLWVQINGFNFHLVDNSILPAGLTNPFGASLTFGWTADDGTGHQAATLFVDDGTGRSASIPGIIAGISGPDLSFVRDAAGNATLAVYATLRSSNTGSPQDHFYDNSFSLITDTTDPWISQHYSYDQGQFYSPGPEPGVLMDIALSVFLITDWPLGFPLPDCVDANAPQGIWSCSAIRLSDTVFEWQFNYHWLPGSTRVWIDGVAQRLDLDYHESSSNTITFNTAIADGSEVVIEAQVP